MDRTRRWKGYFLEHTSWAWGGVSDGAGLLGLGSESGSRLGSGSERIRVRVRVRVEVIKVRVRVRIREHTSWALGVREGSKRVWGY